MEDGADVLHLCERESVDVTDVLLVRYSTTTCTECVCGLSIPFQRQSR